MIVNKSRKNSSSIKNHTDNFVTFFNKIIGLPYSWSDKNFNGFVEVRIFDNYKKYNPFSRYAKSIIQLNEILMNYRDKRWNLYYGINIRETQGRKNVDVKYRNVFYFDVECDGKKPSLDDNVYRNKLFDTLNFIATEFRKLYGGSPIALVKSGRGYHLYYKFFKFDNIKYKKKFKEWYKIAQKKLMKNRPHKDIKFTDSVFDGSRIAGLPGSINSKYDESPIRLIEYVDVSKVFDLNSV